MIELRAAGALALLCVASCWDVRRREIPDYLWIFGGGAGALLYLDWEGVDAFWAFSMLSGALTALFAWRFLPVGGADVLAVLALSVLCPVAGAVPVAPAVFFGGLVLEHLGALCLNVWMNVSDYVRGVRPTGNLDGPWRERAMAFLCAHRRRAGEKFTFCAESERGGRRFIDLGAPQPDSPFERREGVLVTWAMPAMPFMCAVLVLVLL